MADPLASSSFSSFDELLKTIPSKGLCSCPWCPEDKFIPTWRARLVKHLESHWKKGVQCDDGTVMNFYQSKPIIDYYLGNTVLHCSLSCRGVTAAHYHCQHCNATIVRRCDFNKHIANHISRDRSPIRVKRALAKETTKVKCQICSEEMLSSNLKRHKATKHQIELTGMIVTTSYTNFNNHIIEVRCVCVDPKNGIFMARRNSSGIDIPVHVMKRTGTSCDESKCELLECSETARAAARGSQPGYECEHLRSVQHARPYVPPPPLQDTTLEAMVSKLHWLKDSRTRESCALRDEAIAKCVCPVYCWLPEEGHSQRYVHFSVISGTTTAHYWCRFGRSIVSLDTVKRVWKCACSSSKHPCVHKVMAKWYSLQNLPETMSPLVSIQELVKLMHLMYLLHYHTIISG